MNMNTPATLEDIIRLLPEIRASAEEGNVDAQKILGMLYANGTGVPEDAVEAARWYWSAAEQGDADAQYILGVWSGVFVSGKKGIPKSDEAALRWLRLAAEQGHAKAQFALGERYAAGRGVPQEDYTEAERWFRLAAEKGDADIQYKLGLKYSTFDEPSMIVCDGFDEQTGELLHRHTDEKEGFPINYAKAVHWFRLAAKQGHAKAQRAFGCFLATGRGIPRDLDNGMRWYRMGNENLGMSPESCDRSDRMVYRMWTSDKYTWEQSCSD